MLLPSTDINFFLHFRKIKHTAQWLCDTTNLIYPIKLKSSFQIQLGQTGGKTEKGIL